MRREIYVQGLYVQGTASPRARGRRFPRTFTLIARVVGRLPGPAPMSLSRQGTGIEADRWGDTGADNDPRGVKDEGPLPAIAARSEGDE